MSAPTLFQVPQPCAVCGRVTEADELCSWCATAANGQQAGQRAQEATVKDLEWQHRADHWLASMYVGVIVSADDLIAEVGLPAEGSSNQIGAKFSAWAKARRLRAEGVTTSRRRESHGRIQRTWRVIA